MAINFTTLSVPDQNLQLIQQNIQKAFSQTNTAPFVGGKLLSGVSVGSSQTAIPHGLGYAPKNWVLCDQNTDTTVWRSASSDSTNLYLTAATACVVSLWVS